MSVEESSDYVDEIHTNQSEVETEVTSNSENFFIPHSRSTKDTTPTRARRGRKKKAPPTAEEKREREREKKARWRAKKRERESLSHHVVIPHHLLPREVWDKIKSELRIVSSGSPEDENQAFITLLHTIGYEWDDDGTITRAPPLNQYKKQPAGGDSVIKREQPPTQ